MLSFRAIALAAVAFAPSVLGAFEPLAAEDLFARGAPGFEPLEPSTTKRNGIPAAHHLPRAHRALQARGANDKDVYSVYVAGELKTAIDSIKPIYSSVVETCGSIKASGHRGNPVSIVGSLQPHLAKCKAIVHHCGGGVGHPPPPHHSGYPGGPPGGGGGYPGGPPGHHGCGSLLAELIKLIHDLIDAVEGIAKDIPMLKSLIEGYVETLDADLEDLIHSSEAAVPGVEAEVVQLTHSLTSSLTHLGFGGLGGFLSHLL